MSNKKYKWASDIAIDLYEDIYNKMHPSYAKMSDKEKSEWLAGIWWQIEKLKDRTMQAPKILKAYCYTCSSQTKYKYFGINIEPAIDTDLLDIDRIYVCSECRKYYVRGVA